MVTAPEPAVAVRPVQPDDWDPLAEMLALAFFDDPFMTFAVPDQAQRRAVAAGMFRTQLEMVFSTTADCFTTPERAGAAVCTKVDAPPLDPAVEQTVGERMGELFGSRVALIGRALGKIWARQPEGPQRYLDFLGTHPAHRRRGIATAVLGPLLADSDTTGVPATLWTTTADNVAFYRGRGFEVDSELDPGEGAPHVWWMRRDPRGGH